MTDEPSVTYPDVHVQLTGTDSNVFSIVGVVAKKLRYEVSAKAAVDFSNAAFASGSYDEVLQLAMKTVNVS